VGGVNDSQPHAVAQAAQVAEVGGNQLRGGLILHLGLGLLAARAVEHEDVGKPADMRDGLDELHGLAAGGAQGRNVV